MRSYHHGNLKAALLEAARAELASGAEGAVSLRALAARVGVSVNATYRHFASKESLLMELAALGFDALAAALVAGAARGRSAGRRLARVGEAYVGYALREPGLYRLMFERRGRFDEFPRFRASAAAAFRVLLDAVAALRGEAAEAPSVTKRALAAWALVHGYALLALQGHLAALSAERRPSPHEVLWLLDLARDPPPRRA